MIGKQYKKAEIEIVLFQEACDVLNASDNPVDVFDWFDGAEEFIQ